MSPVATGVYQAIGNDATCKTRGVIVQLGLTSMFYNMCLAIYFYLVINHNWKEHQFKKVQLWVHVAVLTTGLGLAFASIPWVGPYSRLTGICAHQKPPSVSSDLPLTLLLTTPISIVLFVMTVTTVAICVKVYLREVKANKWRAEKAMVMTKDVFWQSFWYVMAFNVAQPSLLVQNYRAFNSRQEAEAVLIVSAILAPSQGIWNPSVYFQRAKSGSKRKATKVATTKKLPWNLLLPWHRIKQQETPSMDIAKDTKQSENSLPANHPTVIDSNGGGLDAAKQQQQHEEVAVDIEHIMNDETNTEEGNPERHDQDIKMAFAAVAEYWRLNEELSDDEGDDDDVVFREPSSEPFRRPFRSFLLSRKGSRQPPTSPNTSAARKTADKDDAKFS